MICQECNQLFVQRKENQRFCSYNCSNKYVVRMRSKNRLGTGKRFLINICKVCGKKFEVRSSKIPKYCSLKCFGLDLKEKWKDESFRSSRLMKRKYRISKPQKEMIKILKDKLGLIIQVEKGLKTNIKIYYADAFSPNLQIDFEYDGKYWHQFKNDLERDLSLNDIGIQVIHIQEGEDIENSLVMNLEGIL